MSKARRHHRSTRELFDQRSLALEEVKTESQALTAPVIKRLWFCVYLPQLPLEASGSGDEARVVVADKHGIHRVLLACPKAEAAGIMPGQSANAALALLPTLRVEPRNETAEQQTLESLSSWLEQFTSVVCPPPFSILQTLPASRVKSWQLGGHVAH